MPVKLKEILDFMEAFAPGHLAESWDNPGLAAGHPQDEISKILVALDVTEPVLEEAISLGASLIITHHPAIFRPLKSLRRDNPKGRLLSKAIKSDVALFSAHTNLDIAKGGTNDELSRLIGLEDVEILSETAAEPLNKIVVYAPESHTEAVKNAMFEAGAGFIGNYSHCAYFSPGKGSFKPLEGTNPYIGSVGNYEITEEVRIETICPASATEKVISAMLSAHPYEEPAYDIYTVNQSPQVEGIGRIGLLKEEVPFRDFALTLKKALGLSHMKAAGDFGKTVKKIALCTGAGAEFIEKAASMGADVYITGDLTYHTAQLAYDYDICLIDATHYASENLITDVLQRRLSEKFPQIEVVKSQIDSEPLKEV